MSFKTLILSLEHLNKQMALFVDTNSLIMKTKSPSGMRSAYKGLLISIIIDLITLINTVDLDNVISNEEADKINEACQKLSGVILETKFETILIDDAIMEIFKLSPKLIHKIYDTKTILRRIKNLVGIIFIEMFDMDIDIKIH